MADSKFITGDGRSLNVDDIADIFRETINIAIPKSGKIQRLNDQRYSITCNFTTIDCDSQKSYSTSKVYSLNTITRDKLRCIDSVMCVTDPQPISNTKTITSNNGRYVAHLKTETISGEKKQMLAIWDRSKLLRVINIEEETDHGPINTDVTFGSMSWCPHGEQDKLIYICHSKQPKFQSFFKQKVDSENSESAERNLKGKQLNLGKQYLRVDDWGECLEGVEHTIIAVLDVGKGLSITTVDVDGYSLGDVRWLCDSKSVAVAYKEGPKRLGIIYCINRPSALILHDWSQSPPSETMMLKSDTNSYHTPRVDHSGRNFVYLSNPAFGPHNQAVRMHLFNLDTNQDRELVDKSGDREDQFICGLVNECFSMDDQHILFVDLDVIDYQLCLFDLSKSKICPIKFPTAGMSLFDFKHDVILAAGSEFNATPTLFVATLSPINPGELVAWHQIEDSIHLDEIEYEPAKIPTPDGASFITTHLISPCLEALRKSFGKYPNNDRLVEHQSELPTMVMVHGGPHHAFATEYMPAVAFFCRLGLRSLLINYRGSTGVSQSYVKWLCGKIGELDVNDCLQAIRHYTGTKQIDPKKLIIYGGSHGGFLACHLSCQQEFKFTSAIVRNPVVDLASSYTTTDIPDWVSNEALGHDNFSFGWMPSPEELAQMYKLSPMSRSSEAHVPTLLILGTLDKRVKMYQGERWYQLLRANGVKAECKVYADRHALSEADTYIDCNMSIALWVLSNL